MKIFLGIPGLLIFLASCGNKADTKTETEAKPKTNENTVQLTDAQIQNAGIKTDKAEQRNISTI